MAGDPELRELLNFLAESQIEVRTEGFKHPSERAGGLCRIEGKRLILLDAGASEAERLRALIEAVERVGLESLGLAGSDLSPGLLQKFNRRGQMPWPHPREAPKVARASLREEDAPSEKR